jgi:hypothetical protein
MARGSIIHRGRVHPLTKDTLHLAQAAIRKLQDRRREVVREIDAEIARLEKMITDAGLDP